MHQQRNSITAKIVGIYALFGLAWIYGSDHMLVFFVHDHEIMVRIAVFKGTLFIIFTAFLLSLLIRYFLAEILLEQSKLEKETMRRRIMFEQSPDGILIIEPETQRIIEFNTAAHRQLGYSREEFEQLRITDIEALETEEEIQAHVAEVLQHGRADFETRQRTRQGEIRDVYVTAQIVDVQGHAFYHCIWRDITERKQSERERKQLQAQLGQAHKMEAIGTLAGGIAHDFNNILQPILSYGELLRLRLPVDSPHLHYVERMYTAALRAKELVNQILAFSRQSEREVNTVSVPTILKEVLKLCRSTIPTSIQIASSIQQDCPPVMLDPSQLHQIAMNLIINAYHAVENNNGTITVNLQECTIKPTTDGSDAVTPGRYLKLSIIDTGCGIDPAIREKIFEPYLTTKAQGKGTGLGLSVLYGIVKELRGDIKVHSELDEGTTFDVYLPLAESSPLGNEEVPKSYPAGSGHVLLVDDEELIVEVEKLILETLGYQVTAYSSSIDALNTFKQDPDRFNLVITDLTMPGLTGDQLARSLIALRPGLPIIICSGYGEIIDDKEAISLGVKQFLRKPVTIEEMAQKIKLVLKENPKSQ